MFFTSTWRRPSSVEYPHIWNTFERTSKDGRKLTFTIQDLTEDRYEDMFKLVVEQYAKDEPWTVSTGLSNDTIGLEVFKEYLLKYWMPQNMNIICVLNKEECEKQGIKPKVIGFNLIAVKCKTDDRDIKKYFKSEPLKSFLVVSDYFLKCSPDVFEKYNVDKIITSIGLCVDRDYRLMGISTEILKVRALMCKTFNIPVTMTLFTAKGSQKAAKSAGFQEESSIPYDQLREASGINFQSNTNDSKMMSMLVK